MEVQVLFWFRDKFEGEYETYWVLRSYSEALNFGRLVCIENEALERVLCVSFRLLFVRGVGGVFLP